MNRALGDTIGAAQIYSPADEQFNRRRRTAGLFLGPLSIVALLALPLPAVSPPAHRLAAIMLGVGILWATEAVPAPVTALAGPILAVVLRVAPAPVALAPFADPIIFLFIGTFILAEAMFVHRLDRRLAFFALSGRAMATPGRILFVYALVTTGISMWVSNTATTAMMFPIGMAVISQLARVAPGGNGAIQRFALAMMLATSFAATFGGLATPVGTPPNLIGIGLLERVAGIQVSFFGWMAVGVPIAVTLFAVLALYFHLFAARGLRIPAGGADLLREEIEQLGPLSRGERNVMLAFAITVALWTAPGLLAIVGAGHTSFTRTYQEAVPEGVAAMIGAMLLFVLPVDWRARRFTLTWDQAARIDWGVVLFYGGGLALGELAFSTGLAEAAGIALTAWLPVRTPLVLTATFTGGAILLSEVVSNTATANMVVPVAIAVAEAAGVSPLQPALGATLGASMGFLLPVSTAPNAIVYSSGYVPITAMMRHGLLVDLIGFLVIVALVMLLGGFVV